MNDNPSGPFNDAKLKLKRAARHVSELSSVLQEYSKRFPYDLVVVKSHVTGGNALKIVAPSRLLPPEVGLALGDTIHNLRCALDHLAFRIVGRFCTEKNIKHLYFPIAESEEKIRSKFSFGLFDKHQPLVAQAILDQMNANSILLNLDRLNNIDKHRMLIPLVRVLRLTGVHASGPLTVLNNITLELNGVEEAEMISLGSEYQVTDKGTPNLRLFFKPSDPFGNQEVINTLQLAGNAVAQVINLVEGVFRDGG